MIGGAGRGGAGSPLVLVPLSGPARSLALRPAPPGLCPTVSDDAGKPVGYPIGTSCATYKGVSTCGRVGNRRISYPASWQIRLYWRAGCRYALVVSRTHRVVRARFRAGGQLQRRGCWSARPAHPRWSAVRYRTVVARRVPPVHPAPPRPVSSRLHRVVRALECIMTQSRKPAGPPTDSARSALIADKWPTAAFLAPRGGPPEK